MKCVVDRAVMFDFILPKDTKRCNFYNDSILNKSSTKSSFIILYTASGMPHTVWYCQQYRYCHNCFHLFQILVTHSGAIIKCSFSQYSSTDNLLRSETETIEFPQVKVQPANR